ncbi:hypothetical protein PPACK8108_LOCUS19093 [Phakopsora pachyrhizi]|uniref:40S ribosomal protein S8 n=1 Tax=Phakopsora pachyrhizi TaxID=170000 RepID=A0AAV0BBI1_PHAPC|nr:hypothetical protein PPACK8108_LOCUS19093 [Phakopsora pachyrhizi]
MPVKKDRRKKGRNRLSRRRRQSRKGVGRVVRADDVLQVRRRKGIIAGPTKARMRFGGLKVCSTDKEAVGREEAGVGPKLTTSYEKR